MPIPKGVKITEKVLQWVINVLVIVVAASYFGWTLTFGDSSVLEKDKLESYSDDYYDSDDDYDEYDYDEDTTIPDEVDELDVEISNLFAEMEPNFGDLYENRSFSYPELTYLDASAPALSDIDNYAKSVQSIVYISTEDPDGWEYFGSGSILTSDGVILTNYHVIDDSTKVIVTTYDEVNYPVTSVLASDELLDIALIKIDAQGLTPIPIGDSNEARIGEKTLVIGHAEQFLYTLSVGNVAGFRSYESQGAGMNMQITNPISGGNSGGAVLNQHGEIIGVPAWSLEYDDNSVQVQNLNFAVPMSEVLEFMGSL